MGRHGFPGIFPAKVWHAAAFSCNDSARGICADARISSNNYAGGCGSSCTSFILSVTHIFGNISVTTRIAINFACTL